MQYLLVFVSSCLSTAWYQQATSFLLLHSFFLFSPYSVLAESNNADWPFFYVPKFEKYALDYMKLSRAEYVGVNNIVLHDQRDKFINFTTEHYQDWTKEGHMIRHGNLEMLNTDPAKYNQFISGKTPEGTWVPDIERDSYFVRTTTSPPPRAYGPVTNMNVGSIASNQALMEKVVKLRNQTLASPVKPFEGIPPDEHVGFHTDDLAAHPHNFFHHPVRKIANDYNSGVVAIVNTAVAWDVAMRNLLPDNVQGLFVIVKNSCDQSYTYEVVGKDAIYMGEGDLHLEKFDDLEVEVNLALHTHPSLEADEHHCEYRIVSEENTNEFGQQRYLSLTSCLYFRRFILLIAHISQREFQEELRFQHT